MQVVSTVIEGIQLIRMLGIGEDLVKVNDLVKPTAVSYPGVNLLPRLLAGWVTVWLQCRILSREGRNRCPEDRYAVGVYTSNDLIVRRHDASVDEALVGAIGGRNADIIHSFKDHGILDSRLCQNISIDASEGVRS